MGANDNVPCTGNNNSFLALSKQNGGAQFSRDPLNLINKNVRKVRSMRLNNNWLGVFD